MRESNQKNECRMRLRTIALGLFNFRDKYHGFPPAAIYDASGQPMHSWRVLIVPFMEASAFFDRYRLDVPWNGPGNQQLLRECYQHWKDPDPEALEDITGVRSNFQCPTEDKSASPYRTNCVMVVDYNEPLQKSRTFRSEKYFGWQERLPVDGEIMVVEIENSDIHWIEPRDLSLEDLSQTINDPTKPRISSAHAGGGFIMKRDGAVEFLDRPAIEAQLRELVKATERR